MQQEDDRPHRVSFVKKIKTVKNENDGTDIKLPEFDYVTATKSHIKRYRNCLALIMGITGCPRNLLDYLVENMSENNVVGNNSMTRNGFISYCKKNKLQVYSDNTVKEGFKELSAVNLLVPIQRGFYVVNPQYFFSGEEQDRVKMIKLTLEFRSGTATSVQIKQSK
jgi:hypothetical protein